MGIHELGSSTSSFAAHWKTLLAHFWTVGNGTVGNGDWLSLLANVVTIHRQGQLTFVASHPCLHHTTGRYTVATCAHHVTTCA